ncbi:hypothetical protein SAMN02745152_01955 [Treponema berlinense]|uniref:Uncharacterized protein n=1 Tax=Treponema berlinense TaxID=225004 RepID=A0A1T4QEQ6_9SPIR|nr:hypothetical protein [Treponema berlinense]SKA02219.1 hypothetical protein SAMN02745152_01955 [Treponema berlinense]
MSKKTQEIRSIFQELGSLQKRIENLKSQAPELEEKNSREIDEISFNLAQNLTKLEFWFNSLYAYNGKSKSVAKKLSSRQNGKKGGRPPKKITLLRQRKTELEEKILPSLEHELKFTDSSLRLEQLPEEIKNAGLELQKIIQELEN